MTNKGWVDLLSAEWQVSRRVAKDMLHAMYQIKKADSNLKMYRYKPCENCQEFDCTDCVLKKSGEANE